MYDKSAKNKTEVQTMIYRTKTYVAGAWDEDSDAIDMLHRWNDGDKWKLSFKDAHEITSCRDSSKACTIKNSLRSRLDISKNFILIVSSQTNSRKKGSCQYCPNYSVRLGCSSNRNTDLRSFIDYECNYVVTHSNNFNKIIALYNSVNVNKNLCPASIKDVATHIPLKHWKTDILGNRKIDWCYQNVVHMLD